MQARSSPRDRALALIPAYAGARISETVALDVDDVRLSARKGVLRILGKGDRGREVPIQHKLREALEWAGRTNARTGPEPIRARRCSSTNAAGAPARKAPTT